jgi:hypothetical protein
VRRLGLALLVASAGWADVVLAANPPHRPDRPAPPLPSLPSIARVRIEVAKDHLLVIEEINLPRGTWVSGDLDLYVAFGAPGMPRALDAHLLSVPDGSLEPSADDAGEPIAYERASHRPSAAHLLLGPAQMAGAVLHVKEPAFRRAVSEGNMAAIRIRTLLPVPDEDAQTGREVVVRLGIEPSNPLVLGRLQLTSLEVTPWITRVEAHLCGADADPYPLAIALVPKPAVAKPASPGPVAPVLAVRHASDSLCVRFWN